MHWFRAALRVPTDFVVAGIGVTRTALPEILMSLPRLQPGLLMRFCGLNAIQTANE
jgi:hypothetical protein